MVSWSMHSSSPQVALKGRALPEHGGWKEKSPRLSLRQPFHKRPLTGILIPPSITPCNTIATATSYTIVGGALTMAQAQISHTRMRVVTHSLLLDHMVV